MWKGSEWFFANLTDALSTLLTHFTSWPIKETENAHTHAYTPFINNSSPMDEDGQAKVLIVEKRKRMRLYLLAKRQLLLHFLFAMRKISLQLSEQTMALYN